MFVVVPFDAFREIKSLKIWIRFSWAEISEKEAFSTHLNLRKFLSEPRKFFFKERDRKRPTVGNNVNVNVNVNGHDLDLDGLDHIKWTNIKVFDWKCETKIGF